jgi:nitroreductase
VKDSGRSWPIGLSIRPAADLDSARVEVADVVSGRHFLWSADDLLSYILASGGNDTGRGSGNDEWPEFLASAGDREGLLPGWRHWLERDWHPSDNYYVASRHAGQADTTDSDAAPDTKVLERWLRAEGGSPPMPLPLSGARTPLGDPDAPGSQKISRLMVRRRSGRAYVPKPVPLGRLSGLLWYGLAGLRAQLGQACSGEPLSYLDRCAAAWDFYLCVYDVAGVGAGVYRYEMLDHELTEVRPGNHREAMIGVLQGMHSPATAAWTLGFVADFPRYQWHHRREDGLRRLYLEAGVIAQELIILGMAYSLSTLVTPAQKDRAYLALHGLSPDRFAPVYTLTMGLSRGRAGMGFDGRLAQDATGTP